MNNQKRRSEIRNFAIVGSGMAGLTCAICLKGRGAKAVVYEKAKGPGGRMAAMQTQAGTVDMGAQFFTIRNARFYRFLSEYAGSGTFAPWTAPLLYQKAGQGEVPFHSADRYVGTPRMTALTRALSRHVEIHYRTRIDSLYRDEDGWWLADSEGQSHGPHEAVILTAPPAQAAHILSEQGALQEALAAYHLVPCWAVALHYPSPLALSFGAIQPDHPLMRWVACDSSKPQRQHQGQWWLIHARPDWSAQNLSLTPEEAGDRLEEAFRLRFGIHEQSSRRLAHRWLFAQPTNTEGPGYLWDEQANLGLCGDYLEGGRVEGAFNSAERLLEHLQQQGRLPKS